MKFERYDIALVRLTGKRNKFGTFTLHDLKLSGYDWLPPVCCNSKKILRPAKKGNLVPGGYILWVSTLSKNFSSILLGRQDMHSLNVCCVETNEAATFLEYRSSMRNVSGFTGVIHLLLLLRQQSLGSPGGDLCSVIERAIETRRGSTHPEEFTLKTNDTGDGNYSRSLPVSLRSNALRKCLLFY